MIIAACVVVYVLQRLVPGFTTTWVFTPAVGSVEPWRFLTAAFLHSPSSLLHIVFNMVALWMVGPFLEQSLGRVRYVTLYLVSALAGSVGVLVAAYATGTPGAWNTQVLGASGAVFGLFGAVLVVLRRTGRSAGGIIGVIVLNVAIGFVVSGVAWQAHLGGLAAGALLGAAYAYAPRSSRRAVGIGASLGLVAVLVTVTVAIYRSVGLL
ncbi:MAG: rhomboid family intramembrane serine protease [Cellulomonas sp.]|nr:rhomboid family intramembrane serine protease [Cellulomonas sp.]